MRKLIPFTKVHMKQFGMIQTKGGLMIDRSRLADKAKYARKKEEAPNFKPRKTPVAKAVEKMVAKKDEAIGVY